MRSILLLVALLFLSRASVFAAFLPPDTLQARQDTFLLQSAPKPSWVHQHHRLLLKSTATLAVAGLFISSYERLDRPIRQLSQDRRTLVSNTTASLVSPFGTAVPLHATFATMFAVGAFAKRPKMREAAIVGLGSFYLNSLATDKLKKAFQRHRPSETKDSHLFDGADGNGENTSFPSSHTSNAFAAATAIASVYRDTKWVPQLAYGVATLVGLSRINDNKHWASDVLAGAALGYITGKATYWGFQRLKRQLKKPNWIVSPSWQQGQAGVNASLRF
ncbi:phosphatase PAP2 family protein [Rufibacter latericius]|uniref:Phosphatase PAP2 family protein n=1 Tax=Rufibacter latericius TaxID=2487040 RepID=A0A3M9MLZ9_9BACT|nr:phosphatase PAP2 family protein [Rufibacter latericius]RNI25708.1 phosphatase PAP2 family protein [Rufibacter latericius]